MVKVPALSFGDSRLDLGHGPKGDYAAPVRLCMSDGTEQAKICKETAQIDSPWCW